MSRLKRVSLFYTQPVGNSVLNNGRANDYMPNQNIASTPYWALRLPARPLCRPRSTEPDKPRAVGSNYAGEASLAQRGIFDSAGLAFGRSLGRIREGCEKQPGLQSAVRHPPLLYILSIAQDCVTVAGVSYISL